MTVLSSLKDEDEKEKAQPIAGTASQEKPPPLKENQYIQDEDIWIWERDLFPDIKMAVSIGFPLMLSGMLKMFSGMFTSVMIGRRQTLMLASTSAAMVWTEPVDEFTRAFGLQVGALGSQAVGAGNFPLVGTWCQMSLILVIFVSIPTMMFKAATGPLLELLGVSPHLAEPAGWFATVTSYTTIIELWTICIWGFAIARGINTPDMIVSLTFIFVGSPLLWYLCEVLQISIWGIVILQTIRRILHLVCLIFVTWKMGLFNKAFWKRPTFKDLFQRHRWVVLISLAIPAAFDMAIQKGNGAVTVALAARMGEGPSAAFDVLTQMLFTIFTFCWGISNGFSIILAHRLGAGQPERSKGIVKAGCVFVYSMLCCTAGFLWYAFIPFALWCSHDPIVQNTVISIRGMTCSAVILSGGSYLMSETLIKQGRVQAIFWTQPPIQWLIGTPISILLAPSLGIPGIYWGTLISTTLASIALAIQVLRSDWESICDVARSRAEVGPRLNKLQK